MSDEKPAKSWHTRTFGDMVAAASFLNEAGLEPPNILLSSHMRKTSSGFQSLEVSVLYFGEKFHTKKDREDAARSERLLKGSIPAKEFLAQFPQEGDPDRENPRSGQ